MNIKVITRHGPTNYGSILQSIATIDVVEKLGHDVEIIDYQRRDEQGLRGVLTQLNNKPEWQNPLKKVIYIAMRWPAESLDRARFDRMRRRYLKMTHRVYDSKGLGELDADIFMTGSDQVWGPIAKMTYDGAYFLDFVKYKPKIAYAASFGRTVFSEETIDSYKSFLKDYDCISVREDAAIKIIEDMGLPTPRQVLDPTLLLSADQWRQKFPFKKDLGKYLLVYQIHHNPRLDEYALNLGKRLGLKIRRVSPSIHQVLRGGKFAYGPGLNKFLALIDNAEMLVTDSFHGTAFAINLNTQFVEILPNNSTGSRNQSILRLLGLEDRIIMRDDDFNTPTQLIDFDPINSRLAAEREESINIMRELIETKRK